MSGNMEARFNSVTMLQRDIVKIEDKVPIFVQNSCEVQTKDMNFEQGHGEESYVLPQGTKKVILFLVDIIDSTDKVVKGKGGSFQLDLRFCEKDVDYGK